MSQYPIAVVVGSLRKESFNRQLADAIAKLAPPEFSFKRVNIGDLPLYNQDDDANQADSVQHLRPRSAPPRGCCSSRPNTTAPFPVCSRTRSITCRALMDRAPGRANPQV